MNRERESMGPDIPSHEPVAPFSPEGEPKPQGFRVRVEQPDLIFQAAQKGVSGELGRQLLEVPIDAVEVNLEGGRENFNLLASIDIDVIRGLDLIAPRYNILQGRAKVYPAILQSYPDAKERGGKYIIKGSRGTQFVLSSPGAKIDVRISTGKIEETLGGVQQIVPPPSTTKEEFDAAINDLAEILGTSVKNVYGLVNKEAPDEELVLRPPTQRIDSMPGRFGRGELGGMTTPQELLGKLEIEKPDVSFEDIGGEAAAKREIEGLAFALKNPDLYRKWGTKPPKGVILYGPPGTGKTLMARALASQADARFFHVEASDIASKWYGESEKIVKSIFELANQGEEKTIIFFDEIDAVAPLREGAHKATQRTVSTLLENMDGMAASDNVMVVASTNRLDDIEPALLRAGRFDRWVEVGLPDEEGRKQVFDIHMRKAAETAGRDIFGDVDLQAVIEKTDRASGADIAEIVRRTLEDKVRQEGTTGQEPGPVNTEDMQRQLVGYEKTQKAKRTMGFLPADNGT